MSLLIRNGTPPLPGRGAANVAEAHGQAETVHRDPVTMHVMNALWRTQTRPSCGMMVRACGPTVTDGMRMAQPLFKLHNGLTMAGHAAGNRGAPGTVVGRVKPGRLVEMRSASSYSSPPMGTCPPGNERAHTLGAAALSYRSE